MRFYAYATQNTYKNKKNPQELLRKLMFIDIFNVSVVKSWKIELFYEKTSKVRRFMHRQPKILTKISKNRRNLIFIHL